jgi:hypothetical protein
MHKTNLKRRHHYVWRYYLKPWSKSEKIWCKRGNEIFASNLMGVGQIRDFYKIKTFSPDDIKYLHLMIRPIDPNLQKTSKRWIDFFEMVSSVRNLKEPLDSDEFNNDRNLLLQNTEEDIYAQVEDRALPLLTEVISGNTSTINTSMGRFNFIHFVCNQYFRTNKIQQRMIKHLLTPKLLGQVNIDNCWSVLRHIFSDSLAINLAVDKSYSIQILINQTLTPLLTCDQPIINLYAQNSPDLAQVDDIEFYYPISPTAAVIISNQLSWKSKSHLSIDEVEALNLAMIKNSFEQVYSVDKATLEKYV